MKLLVATRNKKKLGELARLLEGAGVEGVELLSIDDVDEYPERPEDGRTFEANALIKAHDGADATGLPCLADDSGLSVDELNGMPGVLSARWSGGHGDDAANNALLLGQLRDIPDNRRGASFVSSVVLVVPGAGEVGDGVAPDSGDGDLVLSFHGEWRGRVLDEERGDGGFGYDPLFVPREEDSRVKAGRDVDELGADARTAAQLTPDEKDAISHRGRALRQLVPELARLARTLG
ncbi:non-canonical purine NTP pyrophosphatase [Corynebacterium xerosis]|nr:non-canonical purine NTP pyrophosphatase [Corynebacterium xerosis]HJG56058.1 non-canonical purine NTP pyrophosphatase [Corynebacterium xerosis]